ncbi:hypothetical protein HYV89_05785 [Candidatus Woesearchaeota archaeon]|nr:hypothetical protein [Candidatus Woesearchaeota archaeon]
MKRLFHILTNEPLGEEYSFYLTADLGIEDSRIEKTLLDFYSRYTDERINLMFSGKAKSPFYFYIHIADLGCLDYRVFKNVKEYSPDELIDIKIFR